MELLYHYCSTETLVSIVTNRTIRLSSLTLSNDSQEGLLILDIFLQLAREAGLSGGDLSRFEQNLRTAYDLFDGLGFCLSEQGDLLSQWRGYADDGRGVCIGFNKSYLEKLGSSLRDLGKRYFSLKKLIYDKDGQKEAAEEHFKSVRELMKQGAFQSTFDGILFKKSEEEKEIIRKTTNMAGISILTAMLRMFDIKNPAFSEEQEWRLISFTAKRFLDHPEINFRACGDKVVPYFEIKLEELGIEPVGRIVLGPKHQTPPHVVEQLLANSGFKATEIVKSSATYR